MEGSDHYKHLPPVRARVVCPECECEFYTCYEWEPIYLTVHMSFVVGSLLKYVIRLHHYEKIKPDQERLRSDLLKIKHYVDIMLEEIQGERNDS